jgi:hypothetical protein
VPNKAKYEKQLFENIYLSDDSGGQTVSSGLSVSVINQVTL